MSEKLNPYISSVSPRQKQSLLAVYKEYITLIRNLEYIVRKYKTVSLAGYQIKNAFGEEATDNPWQIREIAEDEKQSFDDFLNADEISRDNHYCYISINHTSKSYKDEGIGIYSTPQDYKAHTCSQSLPARIERYVAAYQTNEKLKDAEFLVDKKWRLKYAYGDAGDILLSDALEDKQIESRLKSVLEILATLPPKTEEYTEKEIRDAQTEALASELIAPFENVILSTLTTLSEESGNAIKTIFEQRVGDKYLYQAQKEGLIKSVSDFQDLQNIRHLLYHQWDTLDGLGKFNSVEGVKNQSIRRRYLDSYCRLCDKPLYERINSYIEAGNDFTTLVTSLTPNLLVRGANESNSKFVQRIKEYVKNHPEEKVMLELNYNQGTDKKEALQKNIKKLFPQAEVIDNAGIEIDNFLDRIEIYMYRKSYLEVYQQIEYKMCQYCLFSGKNLIPSATLQYFINHKQISPEDAVKWNEYKLLRNDLSHKYMDKNLSETLAKIMPEFLQDALSMDEHLDTILPKVNLLHDSVYRAVHKDGKIVEIDYNNRRILSITYPNKKNGYSTVVAKEQHKAQQKMYIEEYANGISIGVNQTEIVSCRFPNGVLVDKRREKIIYPDESCMYLSSKEHNCLNLKNGTKLITDKDFKVLNYIYKGKSININKNESVKQSNGHSFTINKNGVFDKEEFIGADGKMHTYTISSQNGEVTIKGNDGSKIEIGSSGIKISHFGKELTYTNRKQFVESYNPDMMSSIIKAKQGKDK